MLTLLYRGSLSSCNYSCRYCPFAKRRDSRAALARDAAEVARFVDWARGAPHALRVLFTPWGEALVRRHYREAVLALAALPGLRQVAVQTNLAAPLSWLADAAPGKVSLWCTYHPGQTTLARFTGRCARLRAMGIAHSVGVVALREHFDAIRELRAALPADCHVWLNPYDRRGPGYYSPDDLAWLDAVDPWFPLGRENLGSRGAACRTGEDVFSVDGAGEVQRCHFVPRRLGNLYTDGLDTMIAPRPCPRFQCDCFIGYAHRKDSPVYDDFGDGVLARVPLGPRPRRAGLTPETASSTPPAGAR